jgi:hypothetical protein
MLMDRKKERRGAWREYIARRLLLVEWVLLIAALITFWDELAAWRYTGVASFAVFIVMAVTLYEGHWWRYWSFRL